MQNNILDKILKYKKIEVEEAKINFPEKDSFNPSAKLCAIFPGPIMPHLMDDIYIIS